MKNRFEAGSLRLSPSTANQSPINLPSSPRLVCCNHHVASLPATAPALLAADRASDASDRDQHSNSTPHPPFLARTSPASTSLVRLGERRRHSRALTDSSPALSCPLLHARPPGIHPPLDPTPAPLDVAPDVAQAHTQRRTKPAAAPRSTVRPGPGSYRSCRCTIGGARAAPRVRRTLPVRTATHTRTLALQSAVPGARAAALSSVHLPAHGLPGRRRLGPLYRRVGAG